MVVCYQEIMTDVEVKSEEAFLCGGHYFSITAFEWIIPWLVELPPHKHQQ